MASPPPQTGELSLTPLGAGDLIDRAIRYYRKNFWTFLWVAAVPVIAGTLLSAGWTVLGRSLLGTARNPDTLVLNWLFTGFGNFFIWGIEMVFTLVVMGGASRNFVRHMLFGEPLTVKETFRNARSRFFGLFFAGLFIVMLLGVLGGIVFYFGFLAGVVAVIAVVYVLSPFPLIAFLVSLVLCIALAAGSLWLFFLMASRFTYIPQVMLVENLGLARAVSRSAGLASGNVKRLMALFIFSTVATYAALSLLYVPLAWYAYLNGIQIYSFDPDAIPVWYQLASQFVGQASLILLMPVWMIGLCLLYIDERVRHEGYDIELMAARRLGEIPALPSAYLSPLHPALAEQSTRPRNTSPKDKKPHLTTLGLGN
jgi:hypothetical protein